MLSTLDLVRRLTDQDIADKERRELTTQFSQKFGWKPNEFIETRSDLTTANILVEQGLDNAALLSFLPSDRRLGNIQFDERREILGLSYNSLVDWHVWIDRESIGYFYNRSDSPLPTFSHGFNQTDYSALTKEVFDQAVQRAPNPNIPALDGALLETIAKWRRILRSELSENVTNASISALFNAIIFARAIEDFHAKFSSDIRHASLKDRIANTEVSIPDAIEQSIFEHARSPVSTTLLDTSALEPFRSLPKGMRVELIGAFYGHPSVPYSYDFSVMSKHALSKIYERYVAVMQHDEPVQFSMFPSEPEEAWNRRLGGIYTPQYIASFFARYLKSQLTTERFIESSIIDPACGSGIFLRTAMEEKILAGRDLISEPAESALRSLTGVDIDRNAVAASRLSLALLYLAARGELPDDVPIVHNDSLEMLSPVSNQYDQTFDAVMMNPPFVRTELQSGALRQAIVDHIGFAAKGKLDTYLAFLALSMRMLRPGGFGFFVLPQSFLTSDSLRKLRDWIQDQAWVRVIADLSAIRIFEASVYVVLLIVQRKHERILNEPPVSLIHCQRDVGLALDDYLVGRRRTTSSYSMFDVAQASLKRSTWTVNTPEETSLLAKLEAMPSLQDVAVARQGAITGADDVFIVDKEDVPTGEELMYRAFLPEKMISRFQLPEETGRRVFYPFVDYTAVAAEQIEVDFPETWKRLNYHKELLSARSPVARGDLDWWRPAWPRRPNEMLAAKIVVPRVFLLPRFGLDLAGQWVVSHSPFIRPRGKELDEDLLLVITAVLNSSVSAWFIDLNARKFARQYNELSVSLLRRVPIPDISQVRHATLWRVIDLTRRLMNNSAEFDRELALTLDDIVLREMYLLSDSEAEFITP